jgi:hypothetical protein
MGAIKYIYDSDDLTTLAEDVKERIDKAVIAAAHHVKDNMRQAFLSGSSLYKYKSSNYANLSKGINVGKLNDGKVKIHALGTRENYDTYKTRFFVGGTIPRTQTKQRGKNIKPYTKGYIRANNAIDVGSQGAENTLTSFIKNVIDN